MLIHELCSKQIWPVYGDGLFSCILQCSNVYVIYRINQVNMKNICPKKKNSLKFHKQTWEFYPRGKIFLFQLWILRMEHKSNTLWNFNSSSIMFPQNNSSKLRNASFFTSQSTLSLLSGNYFNFFFFAWRWGEWWEPDRCVWNIIIEVIFSFFCIQNDECPNIMKSSKEKKKIIKKNKFSAWMNLYSFHSIAID